MEAAIGKIKADNGLGNQACQALGLASYTIAAIAAVVAYNLKLHKTNGHNQTNNTGTSQTNNTGTSHNNDTGGDREPGSDTEPPNRAPP